MRESVGAVFDLPSGHRCREGVPVKRGHALGDVGDGQIRRLGAGGDNLYEDIVHHNACHGAGRAHADGDELSVAVVVVERHRSLRPQIRGEERVQWDKGGGDVGIGHDPDFEEVV